MDEDGKSSDYAAETNFGNETARYAAVRIRKGKTWYEPLRAKLAPGSAEYDFNNAAAPLRIAYSPEPEGLTVRIVGIPGDDVDEIEFFRLSGPADQLVELWPGHRIGTDTLLLAAHSPQVDARADGNMLVASAHRETGYVAAAVTMVATTVTTAVSSIEKVVKRHGLPYPTLDGQWYRRSPRITESYLLTDVTEQNVDEVIRQVRLLGIKLVLAYDFTWTASRGSYQINRRNYPNGVDGLRKVSKNSGPPALRSACTR